MRYIGYEIRKSRATQAQAESSQGGVSPHLSTRVTHAKIVVRSQMREHNKRQRGVATREKAWTYTKRSRKRMAQAYYPAESCAETTSARSCTNKSEQPQLASMPTQVGTTGSAHTPNARTKKKQTGMQWWNATGTPRRGNNSHLRRE